MDPTNRVNDLILITGRLAELLAHENEALGNQRPRDVDSLLEEKNALINAYESRIQGLADDPDELAKVDPDLRERLRGLGDKLAALMDNNARLLKAGMEANRRLVHAVAEAVKSSRPRANTYSASGTATVNGNGAAPPSAPISLDRTL